jgi:hypothetical protein
MFLKNFCFLPKNSKKIITYLLRAKHALINIQCTCILKHLSHHWLLLPWMQTNLHACNFDESHINIVQVFATKAYVTTRRACF